MEFHKYRKIFENIKDYKFNSVQHKKLNKENWVITEKIHGSNFSIYCDENNIKFAKRSQFLKIEDNFYNYQSIISQLSQKVMHMFKDLHTNEKYNNNDDINYIIIYGELFGGWFPDDVSNWKGNSERIDSEGRIKIPMEQRAVQEGVYYDSTLNFIAFDIQIIKHDNNCLFIDYNDMINLCQNHDMLVTQPLMIGKLNELIKYNVNFDSTIPKYVGLNNLENNIAEGIVIKPISNILILNQKNNLIRCAVKIKHPKFAEICTKSKFNMLNTFKSPDNILNSLINHNRLHAVISKVGPLDKNNYEEIVGELIDDIWIDYYNNNNNVKNLDYKKTNQLLENKCKLFVKSNMCQS